MNGIMARSSAPTFSIGWPGPACAQLLEARAPGAVLGDPLLGEGARPDVVEDAAHLVAHVLVDHPRAPGEVAVLGGVRDRVAHAGDPLLVHEVDDQLELVQALEVRRLGLVAGARRASRSRPAPATSAPPHSTTCSPKRSVSVSSLKVVSSTPARVAPMRVGVGERQVVGLARGVLGDGDQRGHAAALGVGPAHQVAGALRGDHGHVDAGRGDDLAEADVEAVGEEQRVALPRCGAISAS